MRSLLPIALGAVLLASSAPVLADSAPAPAATRSALPAITVIAVTRAELTDRVFASGLAGPVETVEVQPRISGFAVESVEAEVGDFVELGQVLARLSTADLELQRSQLEAQRASAEAAIAQAEAQLVQARSSADEAGRVVSRSRALRQTGNVSQAGLDQAEAAATSAEAMLAVAEQGLAAARAQLKVLDAQGADLDLRMQRTEVVAPVAGEVVEKNVTIGAIAASGGVPMFRVVKDGALEVMADVAEQDLLKLAPGQAASLRFVGGSERVSGQVRLVEPQVDVATRLGRVRIALDPATRVRPGMFADAEIIVARREVLSVPVSATSANDAGTTALKVEGGVVKLAPIVTGIRDREWIEIAGGLAEGDEVVLKAGSFVRDGDRINPVPAAATAAAAAPPAPVVAGAAAAE